MVLKKQKPNKLIRLSKSTIGSEEKLAVVEVLNDEFLGMGPRVEQFEKALTDFFKRKAICVSSGTAALQLALQAAQIGYGDEVLVPSITYVASFQAISATGAIPIACDVELSNLCLSSQDIKNRLTSRTRAIMPVHYAGATGDIESYYQIANENGLRVIEDAAHAFGSSIQGQKIGSFGDIVCFSFDGIKNITSGEGGCVVSSDEKILEAVRTARLLGVEGDSVARYKKERTWNLEVKNQGWRYHMSDIMAAIGIEQLKKSEELFNKRKELGKKYNLLFEEFPLVNPVIKDFNEVVPHIYPVILDPSIDRGLIRSELLKAGIQTGVHYPPNHTLELYRKFTLLPLKNTDLIASQLMTLPLHPDLKDEDINYILESLHNIIMT